MSRRSPSKLTSIQTNSEIQVNCPLEKLSKKMNPEDPNLLIRISLSTHIAPNYDFMDIAPMEGTYGLVFIGEAENTDPPRIAVKTLPVEAIRNKPQEVEILIREFEKWSALPDHINVLGGFIPKIWEISFTDEECRAGIRHKVPFMSMKLMEGALDRWIVDASYSEADRLSALAQALNGLNHLYQNGFEGHGDLKPSNILFENLGKQISGPDTIWIKQAPLCIKIADFGWADAWVDLGYTNKAWRQYIAPERLGDTAHFVPEKSDIFSMGIIMAELLQRKHPALNLKTATKSEGSWIRAAEAMRWDLSGIQSERIKTLILSCLSMDPKKRPTAIECRSVLCEELKETHGLDIEPTLDLWSSIKPEDFEFGATSVSSEIHRIKKTLQLRGKAAPDCVERLDDLLKTLDLSHIYEGSQWLEAAFVLLEHYDTTQETESSVALKAYLKQRALDYLKESGFHQEHGAVKRSNEARQKKDFTQAFEYYSDKIGHLAGFATIDFEQALKGEWDISPVALAGFAYHMATLAHSRVETKRSRLEYLNICIDQSLTIAVPYYFRARWVYREQRTPSYSDSIEANRFTLDDIISDLETAIRLDPEWKAPQVELARLQQS